MLVFAGQDSITKVLVRDLPVTQLLMMRYLAFTIFAVGYAACRGGVRISFRSKHRRLQVVRALVGILDMALFAYGLRFLGLAEMHALYAVFPLMTLALAGVMLGEAVGLRRWIAGGIGFAGTLVILRPGAGVFELAALIPLCSALGFAFFNVLTRRISQHDSFATNLLYMSCVGSVAVTFFALPGWVKPTASQWLLIGILSVSGIAAQLLLIQSLRYATAGTLQPFNYALLVFATVIGLVIFGEIPDTWTLVGAVLVIAGGLYSFKAKA